MKAPNSLYFFNFLNRYLLLPFVFLTLLSVFVERDLFAETDRSVLLSSSGKTEWPPQGRAGKYLVTRDTWISAVPDEIHGNNGGANKLKVKSQQEMTLIDADLSGLKGKIVRGALLHLRVESSRKAPLARLTVSSIASAWTEGTSSQYKPQRGSASFSQAKYQEQDWSYPGSTFMDVAFGLGHTIWRFAECRPADRRGWQTCAVDPDVIAARVAGLSYGFALYDDVGSTWSIENTVFKHEQFPNRFFYSREKRRGKPWLEIWTDGVDASPPQAIAGIQVQTRSLPKGEALVTWKTPKDVGGGKTLGFEVRYRRKNQTKTLPRYLIPMAGQTGEIVRMHLQDLGLQPGEEIVLMLRSVDSAGNIGQPFSQKIKVSSASEKLVLPVPKIQPYAQNKKGLRVGDLRVSVVDLLDKINPVTGKMIPARGKGYKNGNHLFSAKEKKVRVQAARNETIFFQVNLEGLAPDISVAYQFEAYDGLKPRIFEFAYVDILDEKGEKVSTLPDPLLPLSGHFSIPSKAGPTRVSGQKNHSLILELYIPHTESPGEKRGTISVIVGEARLEIEVALTVWEFTLPNKLSFISEMNAYKTVSPYNGYDYYRLAHEHRTTINRLPYGWHGIPEFAPAWDGEKFNWSTWDKQVAPLLDGSAFKGLPRSGEPVDVFYLPFNENWPINIFDHYQASYWADEAFTVQYQNELSGAVASFAKHFRKMAWDDTIFQFYLNNKVYHRGKFPLNSSPWILDEPVHTQDFWALRWYGILWHSAVEPVRGDIKMWYRGDISFGPFARNILWGVMDVSYIGQNNTQKIRIKEDERMLSQKSYFFEYGTANKIKRSNSQPVFWSLSAWANGARGILPWNTIGNNEAWQTAQQTALFYPHTSGPKASVRLKAFTVGQQMVEYLTLLSAETGQPRPILSQWLHERISLRAHLQQDYQGDAGTTVFDEQEASRLWELRLQIGNAISQRTPKYKRSLVEWETPKWDKSRLPDIGYVRPAPKIESAKPRIDHFAP